jgi:hypothetical protein
MDNIENLLTDPTSWGQDPENIEKHTKERVEQGFSTYDWWNFFEYNAWVMINALEKFKNGAGHPVYGEVKTMEDWVRVLTEIQDGFRAQVQMANWTQPNTPEWEALEAKWKRGMELMTIYYGSLWD